MTKKKETCKMRFCYYLFSTVLNQIINIKATKFKLTFLFSSKWKGHYVLIQQLQIYVISWLHES